MKHIMFLGLGVVLALGCNQSPTPQEIGERISALPKTKKMESDSLCVDENIVPITEVELSLPAWVEAAESIFVGTIKSVHHPETGPFIYICIRNGVHHETLVENLDECPHTDMTFRAIQIDFEDVETLHGEPLGPNLSIIMGPTISNFYPGITFRPGDPYPIDHFETRVYMPGSRIGAAVVTDSFGIKRWHHRQFEVVNDVVHLGESNPDLICRTNPVEPGIPDDYEGVPLSTLREDIQNTRALTDVEVQAVGIHDGWVASLSSGQATFSICTCAEPPFNSGGPGDPSENNRDGQP